MKITRDELTLWSRLIYDLCGVSLDPTKDYLFESRLQPVLQDTKSRSFLELYFKTKSDPSNALSQKVIDAMTTNETLFFRDAVPFDLLKFKIVPDLIDKRRRASNPNSIPLRIWSAACSTGQEAYSIAISLREILEGTDSIRPEILGTDVSDKAIRQASMGVFSRHEVDRGIPPSSRQNFFRETGNGFQIREEIRAMVSFQKRNLLQPFSFSAPFDIIFCRNVAIYFSKEDQISLFSRLAEVLASDGALIVGATESLSEISTDFAIQRYHRTSFYKKRTV